MSYSKTRILLENQKLEQDYPKHKDSIERLNLEYRVNQKGKGRIFVYGPEGGGPYPLYLADKETLNPKLPKAILNILGPKTTEMIQQKDEEIEELNKTIEEDTKVADDENEQPSVRERAREKITENTERRDQLVREKEQLVEKLPLRERAKAIFKSLRERLKELFKKHGFTLAIVVIAVGITIGVLAKILADGASAAANGIKNVTKKVGDGLKELGKKIGSILLGLVGAIASFVFRAAGQAITFLGKNAWLLILFVAAFLIEKITKKKRE